MTSAPAFRAIGAPLTVSDTDLDRLNQRLGVPTLVPPPASLPAPLPAPVAITVPERTQAPTKAVNVHMPDYVVAAVKTRAFNAGTSIRYVVLKALADSGIDIEPADMREDARRAV